MPADLHPGEAGGVLQTGSGPYFVVRFSPPEQRGRLTAVFAFAAEVDRMVERCSDPGVTRLKLDWWRRELETAEDAKHPLIRDLAVLARQAAGLAAMRRMLDAAEADVRKQQPDDAAGFTKHCEAAGGLSNLLCLATGHPIAGADPLGSYTAAVSRIQNLGRRLRVDHNPLPRDLGLNPDPEQWEQSGLAEACRQLLGPLWQGAERVLHDRASSNLPARRWAAQARAVHRLLIREGFPVQGQHLDITPLGKLWAAWRVR